MDTARVDAAGRGAPRTSRWRVGRASLWLFVAVGLLVGVVHAVRARRAQAARREVAAALSDYAECMIGVPLAEGETAAARMRRIEAGLPERASASGGAATADAWPVRCRRDLDRAHAALAAAPFARDAALARLDRVVLRARDDPAPVDAPDLVDELLRTASLCGVPARPRPYPPPSPHLAPPPASPLTAGALAPLPVRIATVPDEVPGGDARVLRLSFWDPAAGASICTFSPVRGEALREVRCADAGRVRAGAAQATPSGVVRTERGRFDRFELVRQVAGDEPYVTPLSPSMITVALVGDQLVWVTSARWYALTVPPGKARLGAPVDLGEVAGDSPELQICQTTEATVVAVKSFDRSLGGRRSWRTMASRVDGAWRRTPGKAVVDVGATLTCEGHAGTWTWFDRRVVTQVRCNADRCETHVSERTTLPWDVGGPIFAGDLGGRALLLGLGTTPGPLTAKSVASVRMRIAPLAAIASASDLVLWSDEAHDGAAVAGVSVYVRDGAALVLVRGDEPLPHRAIRVDALASFAPVTIVQ